MPSMPPRWRSRANIRTLTRRTRRTFITDYVNAIIIGDDKFSVQSYDVQKIDKGFQVTATGSVQTIFLPLGKFTKDGTGIDSLAVNVTAQVVNSSGRLELALVMDNTGSMNCAATLSMTCVNDWSSPASDSRIVAAKAAAKSLVDIVMPDNLTDNDQVKIAVVPFEGQVNVASAISDVTSPPSWIAWSNADFDDQLEGANFDKRNTSTGATCTTGTNCKPVGHKWLFNQLTRSFRRSSGQGCVEMRAGTYELSDAAPDTSIPDSLFVPYFSPDEPDSPTTAGSCGATRYDYDSNGSTSGGTQDTYANDYLNDKTAALPPAAQKAFGKYTFTTTGATYPAFWSGRMDVEGLTTPYEYGPNRGCPRPIYPLANASNKAAIKTQIDNMIGYYSSGSTCRRDWSGDGTCCRPAFPSPRVWHPATSTTAGRSRRSCSSPTARMRSPIRALPTFRTTTAIVTSARDRPARPRTVFQRRHRAQSPRSTPKSPRSART